MKIIRVLKHPKVNRTLGSDVYLYLVTFPHLPHSPYRIRMTSDAYELIRNTWVEAGYSVKYKVTSYDEK